MQFDVILLQHVTEIFMARVLIVDDSHFMRVIVRNECEKNGFEVVAEASCSNEAIELYKKYHPDIVTMDITMTIDGVNIGRSSNGIDAIKEIMKIDPKAKILVVSAMGQKVYVTEAVQAGAKDFIVKPFAPSKFEEAIKKI